MKNAVCSLLLICLFFTVSGLYRLNNSYSSSYSDELSPFSLSNENSLFVIDDPSNKKLITDDFPPTVLDDFILLTFDTSSSEKKGSFCCHIK